MQRRRAYNYVRSYQATQRAARARNYAQRGRNAAAADVGVRRAARAAAGYTRRMRARNVVTAGYLGVEKKFYDTARALTSISNDLSCASGEFDPTINSGGASTPGTLSCPAQGDGPENRDGKRIVAKYISVKGTVARASTEGGATPNAASKVFVALVLDSQTNGAQMNSEDCFKNLTGELAGTATPERNLLFGSRFKILKSQIFDLDRKSIGNAAGVDLWGGGGNSHCFEWYVPLNNLIINFNAGTTSDVANCIDNSIHLIAFSSNSGGAAPDQITYNARLRFMG